MNCCDEYGDCRQGRDCPIRQAYAKPKHRNRPVAPFGWRYPYVPVKLRGDTTWRETVRATAELVLVVVLCVLATALIMGVAA